MNPTLGLVALAGGGLPERLRVEVAEPAARRGWRLAITVTPTAARWLGAAGELKCLQDLTELPVRSESRLPTEPKPYPMPEAFLFVPATAVSSGPVLRRGDVDCARWRVHAANSLAKLALGIADNQALTALGEAVGAGVPIGVRPQADDNQRRHPAWAGHLATLRAAGVLVEDAPAGAPWELLLDLLDRP